MLDQLQKEFFSHTTFRYVTQSLSPLQDMGFAVEEIEEVLALLREHNEEDSLEKALDGPFEIKEFLPKEQTRFSDGSIRVFYSALEPDTAEAEVQHHRYFKLAFPNHASARTAYYMCLSCHFDGQVKNLIPLLPGMPFLVSDDGYSECNRIGQIAVQDGLDGLLAPSARKPRGTCLPVFRRQALSNPKENGFVAFTFSPATRTVTVSRALE